MGLMDMLTSVFGPVPRYIWEPIARQESQLNPAAWNQSGEDSRGLYQINTAAHPEYANLNLFDPQVNAQIAMRDFIGPAWEQAKVLYTDPGEQASYVWQHGIRPDWAGVQARGADVALANDARAIAGGTPVSDSGGSPGAFPPVGDGGPLTSDFWIRGGLTVGYGLALVLLVVLGAWGLAKAFGVDDSIKGVAGTAAKAMAGV